MSLQYPTVKLFTADKKERKFMSKKVLVLGSSGAMGQYIVPYLANMGYSVTAVSLDDEKPYSDKVTCIKRNVKDMDLL